MRDGPTYQYMMTAVLYGSPKVPRGTNLEKPGSRPAPPRLTRAKREGAKEGNRLSCCVKFGQETVSETFPEVFLGRFLTLIPR